MIEVSEDVFATMVSNAIDRLHHKYKETSNIAFVVADDPTFEQREKLRLRGNETLFGLYEGIPLTARNNGYSGVLPDKITIFKNPMCAHAHTEAQLQEQVHHTLWHETAHHYGLNHTQIHEKE